MTKSEFYSEARKLLSNKSSIRALLRDEFPSDIDAIINRLEIVKNEKEEKARELEAQREKRRKDKEDVLKMMADKGLSVDDFVVVGDGLKAESIGRPAPKVYTYEWQEDGETYTFQGPAIGAISTKLENGEKFAAYLKRTGKKRSDFLIQ